MYKILCLFFVESGDFSGDNLRQFKFHVAEPNKQISFIAPVLQCQIMNFDKQKYWNSPVIDTHPSVDK